jgi:hypothetical protein
LQKLLGISANYLKEFSLRKKTYSVRIPADVASKMKNGKFPKLFHVLGPQKIGK